MRGNIACKRTDREQDDVQPFKLNQGLSCLLRWMFACIYGLIGLLPYHALMIRGSQKVAHGGCLRCTIRFKELLQLVRSTFLHQTASAEWQEQLCYNIHSSAAQQISSAGNRHLLQTGACHAVKKAALNHAATHQQQCLQDISRAPPLELQDTCSADHNQLCGSAEHLRNQLILHIQQPQQPSAKYHPDDFQQSAVAAAIHLTVTHCRANCGMFTAALRLLLHVYPASQQVPPAALLLIATS